MLDRMLLASSSEEKLFVEDCFATHLYTGNGSTQTITNGIDLAGKGGLVWIKNRSFSADHLLYDTSRGTNKRLATNTTNGTGFEANQLNSFNSNGFTLGGDGALNAPNRNTEPYTSWTFRKAPKFFDVVTWTGNGVAGRQIAHNLGVAPGCIIVKRTDAVDNWFVYHRSTSIPASRALILNNTNVEGLSGLWNDTAPTATSFTVAYGANTSGATYVAYLFAHDATADGIIQCGSFTTDASGNATVNLGWEPQWVLGKNTQTGGTAWWTLDNMRGWDTTPNDARLAPNTSNAEGTSYAWGSPTATGFSVGGEGGTQALSNSNTHIYIAIRRGPMKTPTVGTSVFSPIARTPTSSRYSLTSNPFTVDAVFAYQRSPINSASQATVWDRLRGATKYVVTSSVAAEGTSSGISSFAVQNGYTVDYGSFANLNWLPENQEVYWNFRRAPGFFDVVCYTGNNAPVSHSLGVEPELIFFKDLSPGVAPRGTWFTYAKSLGVRKALALNLSDATKTVTSTFGKVTPTSTLFYTGSDGDGWQTGSLGQRYVAYLFASCPGVSKVGSYTGNGSSQTINCGFSNGARFFLVKRTDNTGDWWVYDSARGIVAAADPALALNRTAAEVTSADAVDTESTGIIVNQEAFCNINVSGATYIYLAIA